MGPGSGHRGRRHSPGARGISGDDSIGAKGCPHAQQRDRKRDRDEVKAAAQAVYTVNSRKQAEMAFRWFKLRWRKDYPTLVKQLEKDLPQLLAFFTLPQQLWKKLRTTNVIELASSRCGAVPDRWSASSTSRAWIGSFSQSSTGSTLSGNTNAPPSFYTSCLTAPGQRPPQLDNTSWEVAD